MCLSLSLCMYVLMYVCVWVHVWVPCPSNIKVSVNYYWSSVEVCLSSLMTCSFVFSACFKRTCQFLYQVSLTRGMTFVLTPVGSLQWLLSFTSYGNRVRWHVHVKQFTVMQTYVSYDFFSLNDIVEVLKSEKCICKCRYVTTSGTLHPVVTLWWESQLFSQRNSTIQ